MLKTFFKFFMLFVVACAASIALYYVVVPEYDRVPMGIEINS